MKTNAKALTELSFEPRDAEIFKIPDLKTRLATMQNYFFPRLSVLMKDTYRLIQEVYGIDPTKKRLGFVYCPNHRKDAVSNRDFQEVFVGISGSRAKAVPLPIKSVTGKPYYFPPVYLVFSIGMTGALKVELTPFRYSVDRACKAAFSRLLCNHLAKYAPYLAMHHIVHSSARDGLDLSTALMTDSIEGCGLSFYSPSYHFPLTWARGLGELQEAFVTLYPIFDALLCVARGERHELPAMIRRLEAWYQKEEELDEVQEASGFDEVNLPELGSYSFIRTGLWWDVLARDKWRCCSCGRTAKEDGIVLHVDHILPRSRGGSDCADNLQALCHKCNIGKSNRDSTNLRTLNEPTLAG